MDLIIIVICFFVILGIFIAVTYYTGAFWVKLFKFVYRFFERYWRFLWLVFLMFTTLQLFKRNAV